MTKTYFVNGMTCQHCVASVTEEIEDLPGTQGVEVDLESGRVQVTGEGFSDSDIAAAVDNAGYTLRD